jgi:hypothetical protein
MAMTVRELMAAVREEMDEVKSTVGIEPYGSRTRRVVSDTDRLLSIAFTAPPRDVVGGKRGREEPSDDAVYVVPEEVGCAAYSHRGALSEFTVQLATVSGLAAGSKLHAEEAVVAKTVPIQSPSLASVDGVHALALELCEYRSVCSWRRTPPYKGFDPRDTQ